MSLIKRPLRTEPDLRLTRDMSGSYQDYSHIIHKIIRQARKAREWGMSKGMAQVGEKR